MAIIGKNAFFYALFVNLVALTCIASSHDFHEFQFRGNQGLQSSAMVNLEDCLKNEWMSIAIEVEKCRPDVLYSWGSLEKIERLKTLTQSRVWPSMMRILYMARSPISTFAYGPFPIRIKLRKGIRYEYDQIGKGSCDLMSDEKRENTVFVRNIYFSDFTICSPKVMHSWSYFTAGHWNEIVRELRLADSLKGQAIIGRLDVYSSTQASANTIFFGGTTDDFAIRYTVENMIKQARNLQTYVLSSAGQIIFNPDLPAESRTEESHFAPNRLGDTAPP